MTEGGHPDAATAGGNGGPQSAEEIRAEIEQTREQLGETVEALAEKTDVKARTQEQIDAAREVAQERVEAAREAVAGGVAAARETVTQRADQLLHRAREATPDSAASGAQQVNAKVQENPLPFAVLAAFAAGVIVGWMITRR